MNITEKMVYMTDDGIEHSTLAKAQQHAATHTITQALHRDLDATCGRLYQEDVEAIARWILERYDLRPDREEP